MSHEAWCAGIGGGLCTCDPVSAEATKPYYFCSRCGKSHTPTCIGECGIVIDNRHCDKRAGHKDQHVDFDVPMEDAPVAPPEAEGAREWLFDNFVNAESWLETLGEENTFAVLARMDAYASFKLAQKEAEISRLTNDKQVLKLLMAGNELLQEESDEAWKQLGLADYEGEDGLATHIRNLQEGISRLTAERDKLSSLLTHWQKFCAKLAKIFGCIAIDVDVLLAATDLVAANTELRTALTKLSDAALKLCEWVPDSSKGSSGYIRKERVKELAALAKGE